ncbi:MAG: hypothetical protein R3C59_02410 [Planctomycetaceae bacterium]
MKPETSSAAWWTVGCLWLMATCRLTAADPVTINPHTTTYDFHPSTAVVPDGEWFVWHAYSNGCDQILARRRNADMGPLHTVSDEGTTHGPPTVISTTDGVTVVWSSKIADRWQIVLRSVQDNRWNAPTLLTSNDVDCVYPTALHLDDDSALVAWSERRSGRWRIRACRVQNGNAMSAFDVSAEDTDAFRPVLVAHHSDVWAFWDQYDKPLYSVHGRVVFPEPSDTERISPQQEYCLTPTAISHSSGLHVAWLRKVDVVGGPGVISQWHTLHAAVRDNDKWQHIETPDGSSVAAELTQGLMAQIEPKAVATGGYLGPRVRPMWLADEERVWLLWERKSDHRGSTPSVSGDLVGRPSLLGTWQTPVVLQQGRIDYHVLHPAVVQDGSVSMLASRLPKGGLRTYETYDLKLSNSLPFQQEDWPGWVPVDLPIKEEITPRRRITAAGKTYKLFWADMHCHSGLTADAEGQPDELQAYARDRANLDVVVFTNNDFYNVPLTQYEYELGNLFARTFSETALSGLTRPFLSLPGFEWTSRIPGSSRASLADSRNWLPPYQNASYPNHRSVIFPASGGPLVHFTEVGNDISKLNEAVQRAGGVTLSQHPAFKLSGHAVEVGLELTSGWGNYIASKPQLFHDSLNTGARLCFTANGDTHRRAPGLSGALTGIYAEELTDESILDALRNRRCFATMGAQMFVDTRANDAVMGSDVAAKDRTVTLTVNAIGTRPIAEAILIRNGEQIHRVSGMNTKEFHATFTDTDLPSGTHWYYWRIQQERDAPVLPGNLMVAHGHLAWSTPHWVTVE